jgi:mannan endo-1,4-beta-mannosidase
MLAGLGLGLASLFLAGELVITGTADVKSNAVFGSFVDGETVAQLEAKLGAQLKIVHQYLQFATDDPGPFIERLAPGQTPLVSLEPWVTSWSTIASGGADSYLDMILDRVEQHGAQVYLRIGHEMNGNWYPWSISSAGQVPDYLPAMTRMAGILRQTPVREAGVVPER